MGGKNKRSIPSVCAYCKKDFMAFHYSVMRGQGKYCSKICSNWGRQIKTPEQRFFELLNKEPNGCWVWKSKTAYPNFWYGSKKIKACKWSYQYWKGPVQPGKEICHQCDNPRCVNPDHLFLGTHKENMQDASSKGRLEWLAKLEADRDRYQKLYLDTHKEKEELARRLKMACELLRKYRPTLHPECFFQEVNELESMPGDKK